MTPEEIRELRQLYCVSQERFAHLLGTTVVSVCRWENGKTKPSRLYVREMKNLKANHGSYVCRRKELEES